MKKFIWILLLLIGCSTSHQVVYKVRAINYETGQRDNMETIVMDDVLYEYFLLTGLRLDSGLINPFYEVRSSGYYFYVERSEK